MGYIIKPTLFFILTLISLNVIANPTLETTIDSLSTIQKESVQLMKAKEYNKAITKLKHALALNSNYNIDSFNYRIQYNLGLCYYRQAKYNTALNHYQNAINTVESNTSLQKKQFKALWGLSLCHKKLGNYIEAIKQIDRALQLSKGNKNSANLYINLGNLHAKLKQYELAIEANQQAYQIYLGLQDTLKMSMALNNIGIAYKIIEAYDQALDYFSQALVLKRIAKNESKTANTLNNIGNLYIEITDYDKAEPYLKESLDIQERLKQKDDLAGALNRMADLYLCQKKLSKAQQYLNRARVLLDSTNFRSEKLENLSLFSKLYYLQGDSKNGDKYHLLYEDLNDSLYNELDVSQSVLKSEREKLEAEKESAILTGEKKVLEERNRLQKYQIILSLVVIIGLAGLGWSLNRSRNMKKRLAEELNHRTNNNFQLFLSMLGYQKMRFTNPETQSLLGEIQNRMSAMASVHKLLKPQESLYSVNMQEYIEKILSSICFSFGYPTDCLKLTIPPIELSMKRANYIGFIANEVATNALKYAFPQSDEPELQVILSKEGNQITLFMQDNGKEIPPHDPNISTSLGMTLIEDFTYSLKGTSHFEHTGEGMLFQLEFSV